MENSRLEFLLGHHHHHPFGFFFLCHQLEGEDYLLLRVQHKEALSDRRELLVIVVVDAVCEQEE